jgi:hypothetical protein
MRLLTLLVPILAARRIRPTSDLPQFGSTSVIVAIRAEYRGVRAVHAVPGRHAEQLAALGDLPRRRLSACSRQRSCGGGGGNPGAPLAPYVLDR